MATNIVNNILVNVRANVQAFTAPMKNVNQTVSNFKTSVAKATSSAGVGFGKTLQVVGRIGQSAGNAVNSMNRFGNAISGGVRSLFRFRMEFLSVLFFGMGLSALFLGLVRPAGTLAGVFEVIGTIIEILFLPVMLALLPVLLDILAWVAEMPDDVKLLIGQIALFVAGFGTLMAVGGQLLLLLPALGSLFLELLTFVGGIFGPLDGFATGLLALGAAAGLAEISFRAWEFIEPLVQGIWDKLKESKFFQSLLEQFGLSVEDLKDPFGVLEEVITDVMSSVGEQLGISEFDLSEWKDKVSEFMDEAEGFFNRIKDTVVEFKTSFEDAMKESGVSVDDLIGSIAELITSFVELTPQIADLLPDLIKLTKNFVDFTDAVVDAIKESQPLVDILKQILKLVLALTNALAKALIEITKLGASKNPFEKFLSTSPIVAGIIGAAAFPEQIGFKGFANGGIVTQPTLALVGESGPEIISPLNRFGSGSEQMSPNINITVNANTAGGTTADEIARVVQTKLGDEFRRLRL